MAYKYNPIPADTGGYGGKVPLSAELIEEPVVKTNTAVSSGTSAGTDNGYNRYISSLMEQQAQLKGQKDAAVNAAYKNAKINLDNSREASLKDSYVAYMKGLKYMPQISAVSGNGGYAQSLAAKQQLNYESNRAAIEQNYLNSLRELEANKAAGLISNQENYLDGAQSYLSQLASMQKSYSEPEVNTAATGTTTGEYKYKVGSQTMSRAQLLEYLASLGLTTEQAKAYMDRNNLSL